MRQSWTDERLDDFRAHVDQRFGRVEAELRTQRLEMKTEFESLRRLILQVGAGTIGTWALGILTVLASH